MMQDILQEITEVTAEILSGEKLIEEKIPILDEVICLTAVMTEEITEMPAGTEEILCPIELAVVMTENQIGQHFLEEETVTIG